MKFVGLFDILCIITFKGMIIMKKDEQAAKLFKDGYNCAQAVLAAYCDEINLDMDTALALSSSFGGGMGRLREVCGAVSGMFMVAGLKAGYTDPKNMDAKKRHYELIQEMAKRFKDENGSIICRELLGLADGADKPTPDARTAEYYKKRPCDEYVACAARIAQEVLFEK